MRNLAQALEQKEVVILHGNVRDRYIDPQKGTVYDNLTDLLQDVGRSQSFSRFLFFDTVRGERRLGEQARPGPSPGGGELAATRPPPPQPEQAAQQDPAGAPLPLTRRLARWGRELASRTDSFVAVLFYLDKIVSYKQSYAPDESETILFIEKLMENITPNNRLVMVALKDTMIPVELTTSAPKVLLVPITLPDKEDREAYLKHRLGADYEHLDLAANLTDGLFLRDLDNLAQTIKENPKAGSRELRQFINRYRIGEQQDYWSSLSIEKLDGAFDWFVKTEGVRGQDEAVHRVVDMLSLARAGLAGMASGTTAKPKGVLFFAGPSGVGKTFLAKKLARFLFDSEEAFIRFDMSEFKEEHTVSKFIGSPPGYVGYEKGGQLTGAVREKPFSVILFDEIEKAHPKVMDIFLQILDDGRLTDSRGQTVFFTESVIVFTSNVGARTMDSQGRPINEREHLDALVHDSNLSEAERQDRVRAHFTQAARSFFMLEISRPELLNRIGNNIIPFNFISDPGRQKDIVMSHFARIKVDFEDRFKARGYTLELSDSAAQHLVDNHQATVAEFGGRAITNAIDDEIMKLLATPLLRAEYEGARNTRFVVETEGGRLRVRGE